MIVGTKISVLPVSLSTFLLQFGFQDRQITFIFAKCTGRDSHGRYPKAFQFALGVSNHSELQGKVELMDCAHVPGKRYTKLWRPRLELRRLELCNCAHELKLCRRVVVVCEELLRGCCGWSLEYEKNLN